MRFSTDKERATRFAMRVALRTFGCRLNQAETDALEGELLRRGHRIVADETQAELVVLNTCTITHRADADARRALRRLGGAVGPQVVVTGCYATSDPESMRSRYGVAAIVGNANKHELPDLIEALAVSSDTDRAQGKRDPTIVRADAIVRRRSTGGRVVPVAAATRGSRRSRAFLKVQDGCDYRCSFCIVPAVRGASRSVTPAQIIDQLRPLVESGVPEIVLTGAHLGTWGRDLRPRLRLPELLYTLVAELGSTARLRLSSIDPHEVDDALLDVMAEQPDRICRHLHLPVQSGDPQVLRQMRRGHTVEQFQAIVTDAQRRIPGIGIGTDVIVGFPGESEAAFERTHSLLAGLPLAYHHVFSYSRRQGTPAAQLEEQVFPAEKRVRSERLRALSDLQTVAFAERHVGAELDGVVEPVRGGTGATVLTDNFLRLQIDVPDSRLRTRARVRVIDARAACLADDGAPAFVEPLRDA